MTSRLALLGCLVAFVMLAVVPLAQAEPVQAKSADAFVDSIGVNIHAHYSDTVYWDYDKLEAALDYLGVRHLRDGLVHNGAPGYYEHHDALAKKGLRTVFIVNGDLNQLTEQIEKLGDAVEALEGPNEINLNGWSPEGGQSYQKQFWSTVRETESLKKFPVLGLSYTDFEYAKRIGDLSEFMDYGNVHPYSGGWWPENDCSWMRADLPSGLETARVVSGDKPIMITEIGFTNALNRPGGHVPVTENTAGVYLPRVFLNNFAAGVARTYWYELFNLFPDPELKEVEHNFGLVANDGEPKPSGIAMHNLIALLADPGEDFTPGELDYRLSSDQVRSLLFQKRDGEFWLAVWAPTSLWDQSRGYGQKQEEDPADVPCTITFAKRPRGLVAYTDLDAETPTKTEIAPADECGLTVSERVTLLKITP